MSRTAFRMSLLAGAALALTAGAAAFAAAPAATSTVTTSSSASGVTQVETQITTDVGPGGAAKTHRRVVIQRDGQPPQIIEDDGNGPVDALMEGGPGGGDGRRVIVMRHGGDGPDGGNMSWSSEDGGRMMVMRHGGPGMGPGHMRHEMDPAARAQHLRDILQLRGDQENALQAFLAASKPPETKPERPDHDALKAMTTPERLDWMAARMAEHQARFQKHADAVKRFYAVLSPTQRKAFEAAHVGDRHAGGMMVFGGDMPGMMAMMPPMPPMPPAPPEPPAPPAPPPPPHH